MWIPPEDVDPVVLHAPTRKKIGAYGAVCVNDGRLVVQKENKFNGSTFHGFLQKLLRHRKRNCKMIIILDNARWHHARLIKPWLKKYKHIIELDFLPAYSPELNPNERVWKLVRKLCTHNRYFPELDLLTQAVFEQFKLWKNPNQTLRKLCAII